MPREATTNTVAGSGWEAVVKAKGRVAEFATVAAGEFAASRPQILQRRVQPRILRAKP